MALELVKCVGTIKLMGEKQSTRSKEFEIAIDPAAVDDAAAVATARAAWNGFVAVFKTETNGVVVGHQFSAQYEELDAAAAAVPADADLYTEAVFNVGLNATGTKTAPFTIPAPAEGLFVNNDETSGNLDNTEPNLIGILDLFVSPNWMRISDGEQVVSDPKVRSSRLRSVKSGKRF